MKAIQTSFDFYDPINIDQDIKKLLFANPSLGVKTCKDIIRSLQVKSPQKKLELIGWLRGNLAVYKSKAKDLRENSMQQELLEQVNEHIGWWEEEFGKVTLSDLQILAESSDTKLVDIGWERGKITPSSIAALLDEYMVGQDEYKRELGLTIFIHLLRMRNPELNIPKSNLLVFGPSGVGKTSGIKTLADKLNINHDILNFERVVPEGIQGPKTTDPFTRVLGKEGNDMIYAGDEVDKITDDEIRHELLSILDDKNVISFPTTFGVYREYREVPSKNITCILCGKYDALSKAVEKRLGLNKVGFKSGEYKALTTDELYAQVNMSDLMKVLGSEEICGRIGNFVGVRQLTSGDLISVMLNKKETIFSRYQAFFSANHAKLELTTEGAKELADIAIKQYKDLGVRGLEIVMRQLLKQAMLKVEEYQGKRILIDKEYVNSQFKDIIDV